MNLIRPQLPSFDITRWRTLPFTERARAACGAWATDGYGTPMAVYLLYLAKIGLYIWGWAWLCGFSPSLGSIDQISTWWLDPLALQKAILWSMLFEVLGLGCGSGPLTGRYLPPVGGLLYFLRPGTVRLPPAQWGPFAGNRRGWVDVGLYAALLAVLLAALLAPVVSTAHMVAVVILIGTLGLRDQTIFLAARSEHYAVALLVYLAAGPSPADATAGLMGVWAALWFFAGFSKLNHHFPTVVGVMMSNSPMMQSVALRKRMYRSYPDDLRPSQLATVLGHLGTALELAVPIVLVAATATGSAPLLAVGLLLMLALHVYITANVPMGVPLEWNVAVVYGALVLFWGSPDVAVFDASPAVAALVLSTSVAVPLLGNLFPERVSFLPSMRYYAGNWAMSVWLFRHDSHEKLRALPMTAPYIEDQLAVLFDEDVITSALSKVVAFRLMHLHGRALGLLLPKAIDAPLAEYTWLDGELVAGMVLGWNFGDGHLHGEALLDAIRDSCGFAPGELRVICVESQPLLQRRHAWQIFDGAEGRIAAGSVDVATLRSRQPWDLGPA